MRRANSLCYKEFALPNEVRGKNRRKAVIEDALIIKTYYVYFQNKNKILHSMNVTLAESAAPLKGIGCKHCITMVYSVDAICLNICLKQWRIAVLRKESKPDLHINRVRLHISSWLTVAKKVLKSTIIHNIIIQKLRACVNRKKRMFSSLCIVDKNF